MSLTYGVETVSSCHAPGWHAVGHKMSLFLVRLKLSAQLEGESQSFTRLCVPVAPHHLGLLQFRFCSSVLSQHPLTIQCNCSSQKHEHKRQSQQNASFFFTTSFITVHSTKFRTKLRTLIKT